MKLAGKRVLLTGAAGGIGAAIAEALSDEGADLLLVGRRSEPLETLASRLASRGTRAELQLAELTDPAARERLCEVARSWRGGIDVLVNNAGGSDFSLLRDQSEVRIAELLHLNGLVPILLTRALLPMLESRPEACIVNIGSILGHIGHPGFAVYGASKAALATFSQALSREYAGGSVRVVYVAPRATRTPLNTPAVEGLNRELGVACDPPDLVAANVVAALQASRPQTLIGWPEKLFVRINAVLPGVVDRSFRAKLERVRAFATGRVPALADSAERSPS